MASYAYNLDLADGYLNIAETSETSGQTPTPKLDLNISVTGATTGTDYLVAIYSGSTLLGYYTQSTRIPSGGTPPVTSNYTLDQDFLVNSLNLVDGGSYTVKVFTFSGTDINSNTTNSPVYKPPLSTISLPANYTTEVSSTTFTYDITAPGNVSVALTTDTAGPTGTATDGITKTFTGFTISGAEANAVVQYATTTTAQGVPNNWSTTAPAPTADGTYTVYVRQVDAAGNPSASYATLEYKIDTSAAAPALSLIDTGTTGDNVTNAGFNATGETGAQMYYSLVDPTDASYNAATDLVTDKASLSFAEGSNTVYSWQIDKAGNESTVSSLTFTYDSVVSSNTLTNNQDASQNYLLGASAILGGATEAAARQVRVTLVSDPNKSFTVSSSGNNPPLKADGSWSGTVPANWGLLTDTTYEFDVEVTDRAGNTNTTRFNIFVDEVPPPPPSVTNFTFTSEGQRWKHDIGATGFVGDITGIGEAGSLVEAYVNPTGGIDNETPISSFTIGASGTWTWTPTADGINQVALNTLYAPIKWLLQATDAATNTSKNVTIYAGANAIEYGPSGVVDDPATPIDESLVVITNLINDTFAGQGQDDLILGYAGEDNLSGGGGKDYIYGGSGRDTLYGDGDDDELIGGTQSDRLDGGTGADRFIYSRFNESSSSERDTIVNFNIGEADVINVSEVIRSLGLTGGLNVGFNELNLSSGRNAGAGDRKTSRLGEFWLGDDGALYGNISNDYKADFAVNFTVLPVGGVETSLLAADNADLANLIVDLRAYLNGTGMVI